MKIIASFCDQVVVLFAKIIENITDFLIVTVENRCTYVEKRLKIKLLSVQFCYTELSEHSQLCLRRFLVIQIYFLTTT